LLQTRDVSSDGIAHFGRGARHSIGQTIEGVGAQRVLVLSTARQRELAVEVASDLGPRAAGVFAGAVMHTPVDVTMEALGELNAVRADGLVAIGGGSTIGLGKALAYRTGLPLVAIPTTYARSEATPILGQTEDGQKTTLTDAKVLPRAVLYDPELILALHRAVTVSSALNAMAHAAEAFYAANRTEESDALAKEGFAAFVHGLPRVVADPADIEARLITQKGAWACGRVLGQVGMALHHKLCHVLGGSFGLPHADTHAVILPHALAYNARSAAKELAPITESLTRSTAGLAPGIAPGQAMATFARKLDAPTALKDLGMSKGDLPKAAKLATERPYPNPHPITERDILTLLSAAWAGDAPPF